QPEYRVVVLFTDEFARDRLSQHLGGSALRDLVVVRRVQHSLRQLHADQSAARFLAGQLGVRADAGIDIPGNRAELYVLDRAELDDGLAARSMDLPASVNVVQVDELSTVEADIYGGLPLRTCTSGFSVKKTSNGTKGISTAAHCSNSQTYSGTNLPYQSGAYYSQYDVQWHTAPGFTVVNRIRSSCSTCTRSITGTVGRSSQSVGNYVCKQGKTTGYTCGYITDKSYQSSSPSTATATYIRVSRSGVDLSSGGDSGGPWFNGNNAYGIHHSGIGNDATYMAINYISVLGVSVLTN
ncbi:MAG: S1 family peptidase, partial [Acidobacteriota bacterium]